MDYSYAVDSYYSYGTGPTVSPIFTIAYWIVLIISLVASWKLISKAGEPGWKCLIPIYNVYIMFKIVYGNGWKFLLLLIPIVNIVIAIKYVIDLAKAYGQSTLFGVGMIFVPFIFQLILAFGDSEYEGPLGK